MFAAKYFFSLIGLISVTMPGMAANIVVPGAYASTEATGELAYPFVSPGTVRVEQWIRADQFTAGNTYRLTGMALRTDSPSGGRFSVTDNDFTIKIGSTTMTALTMSANLDSNFTNGFTTVFSAPLALTFGTQAVGPQPWSNFITFASVFDYTPSTGVNLLLDLMNVGGSVVTPLEGQTSCLAAPNPSGCNLDAIQVQVRSAATALRMRSAPGASTSVATVGLAGAAIEDRAFVIEFQATILGTTPEPGTWAMMATGLAALIAVKRRR